MSILDLDKPEKLTTPEKQLEKLKGSHILVNGDIKLPASIRVMKSPVSSKTVYAVVFDGDRSMMMFPFELFLYDNDSMYIANIHNYTIQENGVTKSVTGTQIIETVIKFAKYIGVKRLTLSDGATIQCDDLELSLSHYKLIEKGRTFYEKFGFKPVVNNTILKIFVGTDDELQSTIKQLIDSFRKMEVKKLVEAYREVQLIIHAVVIDNDYGGIDITLFDNIEPSFLPLSMTRSKLMRMIDDVNFILDRLKETDKKYLHELLLDMYAKNCRLYNEFMDVLVYNLIYTVSYNRRTIKLKHVDNLANLFWLLNRATFQLDL